jgi:creatinine amidohydrolase
MLWEQLTASEFVAARTAAKGTCILPLGVIEKHGGHLPLGTDMYAARYLAEEAAKAEPALVFPYYMFGQIAEANHCPGTIAIKPELMYAMLEEMCGVISRNGFNKIVILDCHGGNDYFLKYFVQSTLYSKRDYVVYVVRPSIGKETYDKLAEMFGTDDMGAHAGNTETSSIMHIQPDLYKPGQIEPEGAASRERLKGIKENAFTPVFWYCDHPTHQAGDPTSASAEAGEVMHEAQVKRVAAVLKAIKEDTVTAELVNEFYGKIGG